MQKEPKCVPRCRRLHTHLCTPAPTYIMCTHFGSFCTECYPLQLTTLQDFLEPWLNCTLHCTAQFYMASLTDLLVCGPKTARVLCYNFKGTSYSILSVDSTLTALKMALVKKCLNVRQKLGTRTLSHSLTLDMLNNFCFHTVPRGSSNEE